MHGTVEPLAAHLGPVPRQLDFRCIATGVALCVVPYFIGSLAVLWLVGLALVGGLWAWMKYGG